MIMGLIGWIVFGFVVGLLARAIMPGRNRMRFGPTVLLGIAGALLAGFIGEALGFYAPGSGAGIIASVIGAIIVLWGYNAMVAHRAALTSTQMTPEQRERQRRDQIDRIDRAA